MMEYVILFVLVICVGIYLTDRKGWNATAKRLSNIIRAHIESSKPVKKIETKVKQQALDSWTAEFEGKALDEPKHVIIKTYFAKYGYSLLPHFKCKCGYGYWGVDIEHAKRLSEEHVNEQNAAEDMRSKNGGTHAW
jgi:hypothetical protein